MRPAPSYIGIVGAGISLFAVLLVAIAPFLTFLQPGNVTLWGAATGAANSYIVLAGALIGFIGSLFLLISSQSPKLAVLGGGTNIIGGLVVGGIATYLLTNSAHKAVIAQGGSFGIAAWILVVGAGGLLVGGIIGLVRGVAR